MVSSKNPNGKCRIPTLKGKKQESFLFISFRSVELSVLHTMIQIENDKIFSKSKLLSQPVSRVS